MSVLPRPAPWEPKPHGPPNKSGEHQEIRRRYLAALAAKEARGEVRSSWAWPEPPASALEALLKVRHQMLNPPRRGGLSWGKDWADEGDPNLIGLRRSKVQYDPGKTHVGKSAEDEPDPGWDDHVKLLEEDEWQLHYQDYGGCNGHLETHEG